MNIIESPSSQWQPWDYRESGWQGSAYNLTDYRIEATDGEIGKVDQATYDVGASYLVVNTGTWILGRKVMLPAGVVSALDHENQRVMLDLTREQIKNAPAFDPAAANDSAYLEDLGAYYGESGAGWSAGRKGSL
jgi:hypothetical protein